MYNHLFYAKFHINFMQALMQTLQLSVINYTIVWANRVLPRHDRYLLKKGPRRSREPFALSSTWKNRAEEEEKEKPEHRRRRRAATLKVDQWPDMTSAVTSCQLAFISSVHVLLHCDQAEREEVDEPPPPPTEGSDSRGVWGKKITFRRAVNTIVTGQRIHNEITVGAVLNMFSFFRFHRVTSCVQLPFNYTGFR